MKRPNKQVQQQLEKLAAEELDLVKNNMIWQEDGRYHVFGRYEIALSGPGCVLTSDRHDAHRFGSVRSALAWCIADKYQRHDVSRDICNLDQQQQIAESDIAVRSHLARKIRDASHRESALLKIDHRRRQLSHIQDRLTKCINVTKYWQIRGFNNETQRTGRTPSHTKSR